MGVYQHAHVGNEGVPLCRCEKHFVQGLLPASGIGTNELEGTGQTAGLADVVGGKVQVTGGHDLLLAHKPETRDDRKLAGRLNGFGGAKAIGLALRAGEAGQTHAFTIRHCGQTIFASVYMLLIQELPAQ